MKIWEATIEILRDTDNHAVMWGDHVLLHQIAKRAGWKADAWVTEEKVLKALSRNPGPLIAKKTWIEFTDSIGRRQSRTVRVFRLTEEMIVEHRNYRKQMQTDRLPESA